MRTTCARTTALAHPHAPTSGPRGPRQRRARGPRRGAALLAVAALVVGCTAGGSEDLAPPPASDAVVSGPSVAVDGDTVVLDHDGATEVVATVEDAEVLHAAVRPGHDRPLTVLVLIRDEERFSLRYLDVVDGEATDLYGLPFRLQVDPDAATVADVPPVPVWSPDGERVAWLEWTPEGTRLRTLGWLTYEAGSNPSEDRADWDLTEVPVGTQLDGWEVDRDGTPVLVSRVAAGERWRIRLEQGGPIAASGSGHRT